MREKLLFDFEWKFHPGDMDIPLPATKAPLYFQSKTERAQWGPASYNYIDNPEICIDYWETVDLPHDYIINQVPDKKYNNTLGFFKYHNAWYRKKFKLEDKERNKRITIMFEGIAVHATVYVNGCLMARNFCGYTSFEVDITDVVRFNEDNIVAVYVEATEHEGWWYEGAGIYRHVWLVKTELVSVDLWGVWVNPCKIDVNSINEDNSEKEIPGQENWEVPVETTLRNDDYVPVKVQVQSTIIDNAGNEIANSIDDMEIAYKDKKSLKQRVHVINPELWDIDSPNLYILRTRIFSDGHEIDCVTTRFGFRTIAFCNENGFYLNGKNVKIKGVCCHQDYGLTGKAMPDRVQRYRLRRLKEMGANGYRTAHYPPAEATMDALDELGFLVMDETRWFESTKEGTEQLEMLIKRDRNHPSVIMWSIGNEEPLHRIEAGKRIVKTLTAFVKKYDTSRPVTTAISHDPLNSTAAGVSEVIGVNYNLDQFDELHVKYPHLPFIASECCAVGTTRGWYFDDDRGRGYISAYDHSVEGFPFSREDTWKYVMERRWVSGEYQWAGIEHRGETDWPRLCSQSGAMDLFLQPKDAYYQNMSHWSDTPMVHILPHWNHPGREGEKIPVWVYTSCEEAELFQDGKSLGIIYPEKYTHAEWLVEYKPGSLKVEGRFKGKTAATETVETTGPAVALKLRLEDEGICADNEDMAIITCWCVDEKGRTVPDAAPYIHFYTNSLGKIVGTGSDICDHTPVNSPNRQMRAGLCSAAVKIGSRAGTLKVYAQAAGLEAARLEIEVTAKERRPWIG